MSRSLNSRRNSQLVAFRTWSGRNVYQAMRSPRAKCSDRVNRGWATVAGVAIEDHWKGDRAGDVAAKLDALGGGEDASVGECGVVAAGDAGAHERRFAARGLHDLCVEGVGRAQHGQHPIVASQQQPKSGGRSRREAIRHGPGQPALV